jgi:hypothetical protein
MSERLFTAREVQAAIEAVIRYERARSTVGLRLLRASVEDEIHRGERFDNSPHTPHMTLEAIRREAGLL